MTLFPQAPPPLGPEFHQGLHPSYFDVCFEYEGEGEWPASFATITGHATTGEKWTPEQNAAANEKLEATLRERGIPIRRITGYSPTTGHAEPGFAVALGLHAAAGLGREFRQDAIYFVEGDALFVSSCARPTLVPVGAFRERLNAAGQQRFRRPGYV